MTKNQKIIAGLITIFIIVVLVLVWWFVNLSKSEEKTKTLEGFIDTYIFGNFGGDGDGIFGQQGTVISEEDDLPKLRKITSSPTAGFISFLDEKDRVLVRYAEKATGHIYEATLDSTTLERVSNTTIPKLKEAVWVGEEDTILSYTDGDSVKSFYAKVVEPGEEGITTVGKTEGVFLWDDILGLVPAGGRIIYFLKNQDNSHFFVSDLDGENSVNLFSSPLTEWLIQRPKEGLLLLTTKPSFNVFGYTYLVNIDDGKMNKILPRTFGLTTLVSSDVKKIIFSQSQQGGFSLNLYNIKDKKRSSLDINTLPEKCAWGENNIYIYCGVPATIEINSYPNVWYQGLVSFSDNIIKLDTRDGEFRILATPSLLAREDIDIIKPALGPKEENLFFINKKDSSLWVLELVEDFSDEKPEATTTEEIIL